MKYAKKSEYGSIRMTTPATTSLTVAGTDYLIDGTFDTSGGGCCNNFTQNADGSLTYSGAGGVFQITGTSDVEVDKACTINYTLYMDSTPDGTTPHDFTAAAKSENISIVGIITLTTGMVLSARAKSNTANTALDPLNLNVSFILLKPL